ncbi:NAD-binding protein [Penicillium freii]|nr:NAD-binding protein [Penicillium freii]
MSTTANRNDPVVVITGAGRGIGVSIAHSFAKAGSTLCLIARSSPELEAVAQELIREYNISVETWAADISDIAWVVSVAQEIETRHGRVDVLVNLLGPVVLTRTLLPCILQQGTGTIISIGSRLCGGSAKYLSVEV